MRLLEFKLALVERSITINPLNVSTMMKGNKRLTTDIWMTGDTDPIIVKGHITLVTRRIEAALCESQRTSARRR